MKSTRRMRHNMSHESRAGREISSGCGWLRVNADLIVFIYTSLFSIILLGIILLGIILNGVKGVIHEPISLRLNRHR